MRKELDSDPAPDLRPNPVLLISGTAAIAAVSMVSLSWPVAGAATVLGALMVAGAEIDARTFLLPDTITCGAAAIGIIAAVALDPIEPGVTFATAAARAAATASTLALVRWAYHSLTGREGLGVGDIKLAVAIGAWLPLEAIPRCFLLATLAALIAVLLSRRRGHSLDRTSRIPFGAFLCPALWITFYAGAVAT